MWKPFRRSSRNVSLSLRPSARHCESSMRTEAFYAWFARYYDLIHAELREDLPYWVALGRGAAGTVLELGCGSGRVLLPLARAGIHVTGLDNAPEMLALAQELCANEPESVAARITLVEADMTAFSLSERFALTIVAHNTFSHLPHDSMARCLRAARRHLIPGGRLVLDLPNPLALAAAELGAEQLVAEATFVDEATGDQVVQAARSSLDSDGRCLHVTWRFDVRPADGGSEHQHEVALAYHLVYPHELELMLVGAGLRLVALAGNYDNSPFGEDAERLLVTAQVAR